VLVEINTACLHKPIGEAYPDPGILRRLCEAGVPITFGSDAHEPGHVGRDFDHAARLARSAGYTRFASLEESPAGRRAGVRMNAFAGGAHA
jgi:histidinol phosphatase-like PHP family hydrolase